MFVRLRTFPFLFVLTVLSEKQDVHRYIVPEVCRLRILFEWFLMVFV